MSDSQEQLRAEYESIRPHLETIAQDLSAWLTEACRRLGIYAPRVDARAKETHSYLTKIASRSIKGQPFGDPLREMTDKIGARADLVYDADVDRLVAAICAATDTFEAAPRVVDKRQHDENAIGYSGVHVDVVPLELRGLERALAGCELQIRTNAQAAWAMASHQLVYKAPIDLPPRERRNVNRLTVLLELFDEQVAAAHDVMTGSTGYPLAIIVHALQAARSRFLGSRYDEALTRTIVTALAPVDDAEKSRELVVRLHAFVAEREAALAEVVPSLRPALVGQPEALLVFMRLDEDRYTLAQEWTDAGFDFDLLRDLAGAWAVNLPDPV